MGGVKASLVVHGGAGSWRGAGAEDAIKALRESVEEGLRQSRRGNCIDMVVEAVSVLEDSGLFNAGLGSTLDYSGGISMDAGLMSGCLGKAGAVAAVTYPRNPVRLARMVLERTPHILIAGRWADDMARREGLDPHPGPHETSVRRWRALRENPGASRFLEERVKAAKDLGLDTVGAVALDDEGCIASATSTGGVALKLPGRVGDSAIPGAGFYADRSLGVSVTGIGETIIYAMPGLRIAYEYNRGKTLQESVDSTVNLHTKRWGRGTIGVIALDRHGTLALGYNTEAMPWAYGTVGGTIESGGLK